MEHLVGINTIKEIVGNDCELTYKYGGTITRIFYEEMKYVVIKALNDPKIDVVKEMDKVEKLYRFNATMDEILSGRGNAKGGRDLAMDFYNRRIYPTINYRFNFWPFDVLYDGTLCTEVDTFLKKIERSENGNS